MSMSHKILFGTLLLGASIAQATPPLVCTDRWGHRYAMVKPPTEDTENITCVPADGSAARKGHGRAPVRSSKNTPAAPVGIQVQAPAPVVTAVIKPVDKAGAPTVIPVQPEKSAGPGEVSNAFGFGARKSDGAASAPSTLR